jgi:undecaprenyl-diphosphatase
MHLPRYVLVGLLVIVLTLSLFAVLAANVTQPTPLTKLDNEVSLALHREATLSPAITALVELCTHLGGPTVLTVLGVGVAALLIARPVVLWRRHARFWPAAIWALAVSGGALLNTGIKLVFGRLRPGYDPALLEEGGYSFPSGHSMNSFVVYAMLAYFFVLILPRRRQRVLAVAGLSVLVLAIGFSRAYLGVHWPSDVVGGYLMGAAWVTCCILWAEAVRRHTLKSWSEE